MSLPKLRARWPDTAEQASAAIAQWRAAKRGEPLPAASTATACLLNAEAELTNAAEAVSGLLQLAKVAQCSGRCQQPQGSVY